MKNEIPIWEKVALTIDEAASYSNIGQKRIDELAKEPCEGCKHNGNYENELEYGYPSPRTKCKRRCNDNYQPYTES